MSSNGKHIRSKTELDLYDHQRQEQYLHNEKVVIDFLNQILGLDVKVGELLEALKDGVVLCRLINKIRPGTIKHVGQKDLSFVKMDNITSFLQGAKQIGLTDTQLFETSDLFEGKDFIAVLNTVIVLQQLYKQPSPVKDNTFINHQRPNLVNKTGQDPPIITRPPKSPLRPDRTSFTDDRRTEWTLSEFSSVAMSSSSCSSLSSLSSIASSSVLKTPTNTIEEGKERRRSHQPKPASLGHSSHHRKSLPTEDRSQEKLLLKIKDGASSTHYQLGNCIGKGQFGSVFRALDLGTGEIVAVKRIKFDDGELDKEITKEVSLLKTLSHLNVICYLGFIRSKHHINIILEYAENGSLMSTLKSFGAFPEKLVCSFCVKILNGLDYLHSNDVVHCDLKAANILTTKTGDVKLTDFGVSLNLKIKPADAETVSGTPNWMAPEVIELKGASTKSDIWKVYLYHNRCTLIELVTGKPPYSNMNAMSAMFRIVEDDYPPLPDKISDEMRSFLICCFQKNPKDRPTAAQLKNHLWLRKNRKQMKRNKTYSQNLTEPTAYAGSRSRASSVGRSPPLIGMFSHPQDYITHRFIQTSFGKVVECKVCKDAITSHATFCKVCGLICHEPCKKLAFSCPPKVENQQPSYDWVFSAKVYNRPRPLSDHPHADSIRRYSEALGLTPQEQQALCDNPALLTHTLAMEKLDSNVVDRCRSSHRTSSDSKECVIN